MSKTADDVSKDNKLNQLESKSAQEKDDHMEILHLLNSSLLGEQKVDDIANNLDKGHFQDYISKTEINLSKASSLLASINGTSSTVPKDIVLYTILLSGENSEDENWTSPQIQCLVKHLQNIILQQHCCQNITDLLLLYKLNYFLTELKPKLLSSTWKSYPAAVVCFIWILHQYKVPCLGDNIGDILPTCLLLVDDHLNSNKIKGLKCLTHLTSNVSRTELIQYGRGDVIYNAVEHMIYFRDAEIIPHMSRFLVEFLSKTEHDLTTSNLLWTRFDNVLNIWLPSMEMEQSLVLRKTYIDSLTDLLQAMGIASLRWSVKLLSILAEYSEQDHTLDKSLLCLLTFIRQTWPKISSNAHSICFILMKVTIRVYKDAPIIKPSKQTEKLLKECFSLFKEYCGIEGVRLCNKIRENRELYQCCKYVLKRY